MNVVLAIQEAVNRIIKVSVRNRKKIEKKGKKQNLSMNVLKTKEVCKN